MNSAKTHPGGSAAPAMDRRSALKAMLAWLPAAALAEVEERGEKGMTASAHQHEMFIGTYTRGKSRGIYRVLLDGISGRLSVAGVTEGVANPSFLAVHPSKKFLYAASEINSYLGRAGGAVCAFALGRDGRLERINCRHTHGEASCHVALDRTGKWAFAANYSGGSFSLFPVTGNGGLEPAADVIRHEGAGPNKARQEKPHPHSVNVSPDNRLVVVADLGIDKLMLYRFDAENGELAPNDPPFYAAAPGAGPRHFAFHPDGKHAFVINELDSTLQALAFDAQRGAFAALDTGSTLPANFKSENTCAEVRVSPDGRFVYGSNRGHDSIAIFSFDCQTGRLAPLGYAGSGGRTPRSFALTPDGAFVVAANQQTDNIVSFSVSRETGALLPTGYELAVPEPVCVAMV